MRKRVRRVLIGLLGVVAVLGAYETWRVLHARAETPRLIRDVLANADPELDRVTPQRIDMLLTIEDPTFRTNSGIDQSSPAAGGTTLTQALGKMLYYDRYIPYVHEPDVMLLSVFALTPRASKDQILKAFMSKAYLGYRDGKPVIGFAEGARRWFGRELSQLSDDEFLALVAMLPGPGQYNPTRPAGIERLARIKRLLAGECRPRGHMDVPLEGCAAKTS